MRFLEGFAWYEARDYVAARSGVGAAMLPRFWGDSDPSLVRLDVDLSHTGHELSLLYHRDLKGSQRVLAVRDFVQDVCRRTLPGGA